MNIKFINDLKRTYFWQSMVLAVMSLSIAACDDFTFTFGEVNDGTVTEVLEELAETSEVDAFLSLLKETGVDITLLDLDSEFTLFVPSDEALESYEGFSTLDQTERLALVLYHILDVRVTELDAISQGGSLAVTQNLQAVVYDTDEAANFYVNDSLVIESDIEASNGVIHIVDKVLTPQPFLFSSFSVNENVAHERVPAALIELLGADAFVRYFYSKSLDGSGTPLAGSGSIEGEWFAVSDGVYPYQIWIPSNLDENMPVSLILHTRGEQGDDNFSQIETALATSWVDALEEPTIVIAPQAPTGTAAWAVTALDDLLTSALMSYDVNYERMYISGHSFGGRGVLNMLSESQYPFAAAALFAPSGADYSNYDTSSLADTPQWYVLSEVDHIVDYENVFSFYEQLVSD